MHPIIKIENLSKQYRLGTIGTGTLRNDMKRWWYTIRGKEDPFLKIGENNDRSIKGNSEYVWALRDINLEIVPGEVLGIIGKNGAGKSTLLKILSKVTGPTTGKIHFNGRIGSLLEVGTGFHPELTGRENIFLNGAILGMTKQEIKGKLDEIIDFSGCERYIDTPVKRYSSGMMVRLGFAVAAHLEPEILVVDEVLAVGDAEFQKKAIGKMQDVSKNYGRTVLFVSHNMAAISALCSRAILLNNGGIHFSGNVKDVLNEYLKTNSINSNGSIIFNGNEPERFGEKNYGLWKGIQLLNQENKITNIFKMGEKMKILLEIEVFKISDHFEIGIGIINPHGIATQYFVSCWEGVSSIKKKGKRMIEVEIPQINTFPGKYMLNIWIALRGALYDDAIHNAISFQIKEGKVNEYDTYFERFSQNTQVYSKSLWEIK